MELFFSTSLVGTTGIIINNYNNLVFFYVNFTPFLGVCFKGFSWSRSYSKCFQQQLAKHWTEGLLYSAHFCSQWVSW